MGKGNTFINDWLNLVFNATPIANLADNAASSPLGYLYVSLHTANPGAGGDQTTSECAYTSYARVAVVRTSSGWTVASAQVTSPAADITFPTATGGTETATYAAIGTDPTGTGKILYSGQITPNISISSGIAPIITSASTVAET